MQLWADRGVGPDHVDFNLPATGEQIVLYDATGAEVDQVVYPLQVEGVSEGRLPDGERVDSRFPGTASPGASNSRRNLHGPGDSTRSSPATRSSTWAVASFPITSRLHNPGGSSFDLGGMSLSVNEARAGQWIFPPGTHLGPNAFLLISLRRLATGLHHAGQLPVAALARR